ENPRSVVQFRPWAPLSPQITSERWLGVGGGRAGTFSYGFIPPGLFLKVKANFWSCTRKDGVGECAVEGRPCCGREFGCQTRIPKRKSGRPRYPVDQFPYSAVRLVKGDTT